MLLLFAPGVMSLIWRYTRFAVCFAALGIWVAAAPGSVPQLTQPGASSHMQPSMQP
jgi:hypothetical protein